MYPQAARRTSLLTRILKRTKETLVEYTAVTHCSQRSFYLFLPSSICFIHLKNSRGHRHYVCFGVLVFANLIVVTGDGCIPTDDIFHDVCVSKCSITIDVEFCKNFDKKYKNTGNHEMRFYKEIM